MDLSYRYVSIMYCSVVRTKYCCVFSPRYSSQKYRCRYIDVGTVLILYLFIYLFIYLRLRLCDYRVVGGGVVVVCCCLLLFVVVAVVALCWCHGVSSVFSMMMNDDVSLHFHAMGLSESSGTHPVCYYFRVRLMRFPVSLHDVVQVCCALSLFSVSLLKVYCLSY